jgi:hypothetical protein
MKEEIELFVLVLSILYSITFTVDFVLKLVQENPEPMKISKLDGTFLYLAISYIITYFLI